MKKWKKRFLDISIIAFVIVYIVNIILKYNICHFSAQTNQNIEAIFNLIIIFYAVAIIICIIRYVIILIKRGIHNIKKCDDELFNKIDQYKECWREDEDFYIKQIQIINLYYKKGGKVDELVNNQEIERLFARADFLLNNNSLFDNLINCFNSLVFSFVAIFVGQMMASNGVLPSFVWLFTILFFFFVLVFFRYAEKGQAGSYRYYLDDYERSLLLEKIKNLENEIIITDKDEKILEMKQVVIHELIRLRGIRKFKKQKKQLEIDIKQVQKLNLFVEEYDEYHIENICINGSAGYLLYDQEKGKENNYIGENHLINRDYSILYQILKRYDLISYFGN